MRPVTAEKHNPNDFVELTALLETIQNIYAEKSLALSLQEEFQSLRLRAWLRSNLTVTTLAFAFLAGLSASAFYLEFTRPDWSALYLLVMAIFIGLAVSMYAQRNKNWERNDNLIDAVIPHFLTSGLLWRLKSQLAAQQAAKIAFVETGGGKGDHIVSFRENLFAYELSGLLLSPNRADRERFIRHVSQNYPGKNSMEPIRIAIWKDVATQLIALERAIATGDMTCLADCSDYALDRLKDASLSSAKVDPWKIEWAWKIINEIRHIRADANAPLINSDTGLAEELSARFKAKKERNAGRNTMIDAIKKLRSGTMEGVELNW